MRSNRKNYLGTALSAVFFTGLTCGLSVTPASVRAAAVPARPAHSFVNSVGLNTKFGWLDSPYRSRYAQVKARLTELGIRHIRDIVSGPSAASTFRELYLTLGVRLLPVVDLRTGSGAGERLDPSQIKSHIDAIRTTVGTAPLVGVEGPNEANLKERIYGYTGWPTDLRRFQEKLYSTVRADPAFVGRKVIQPSLAGPNSNFYYARMGNYLAIADIGNLHIYSNWLPWENGATREYDSAQPTMSGRPFWATESGWHTAITAQSLNKFTMLRYVPRALVGFASFRNMKRGYIYQLMDNDPDPAKTTPNFNYGLIDYNGNVKPGFYAVRNMMHVLCDDPLRSAPGALSYSLSGSLTDLRTLLYKKNNGAFYLVTWLEKPGKVGLSPTESKDIIYPPQAVTIKFEQSISLVRRYEPGDPYGDVTIANDAKQSYSNPRSLNLSVRDSVTILEIVPAGVVTPAIKKSCSFKATA
jgi:hypothetical protein